MARPGHLSGAAALTEADDRWQPGDGLPTDEGGEPLLARWFVIGFSGLLLAGVVVIGLILFLPEPEVPVAERRPPGPAGVTHDRGEVVLGEDQTAEPGPSCGGGIVVLGDPGARAAAAAAFDAACKLIRSGAYPVAKDGLGAFTREGGRVRYGVFGLSGVDASSRLEDGRPIIELNARFQFEVGERAAPFLIHELAHFSHGLLDQITAEQELFAMQEQDRACRELPQTSDLPRGCDDAAELLALDDPREALRDAGFPVIAG